MRHGSSCGCPNCMEYGGPRSFERSIVKPTYEELESQLAASQERERILRKTLDDGKHIIADMLHKVVYTNEQLQLWVNETERVLLCD